MQQWKEGRGFTIVELLIVVVVIAILAAVTIVAFNGIKDRASSSAMAMDFAQASKMLEAEKAKNGTETYPSAAPSTLTNNYSYSSTSSGASYCLTRVYGGFTYFITPGNTTNPIRGVCTGLIGWWRMNGDANDSSGLQQNGTITSATASAGQNGLANGSILFNSSTAVIDFNNPSVNNALKPGTPFSYSAWVKPVAITSNAQTLFSNDTSQCGGANTYAGIRINIQNTGALLLRLGNGGSCASGSRFDKTSASVLTSGVWSHIVITVDSARVATMYINGADAGGSYSGTATTLSYTTATSRMALASDSTERFAGNLDDVRLYGRDLSATEVNELYSAGAQ